MRSICTLHPASVRTQIRGAHAQSSLALCDPWTLALQAPLSMGLSRENTGVGWYVLLQGVFPAQGWNPRVPSLLHQQVHPSPLRHQGARAVPLSSAEKGAGPLELSGTPSRLPALKGPPSLWAPPGQVPILGGGPGFPPWTGVSPGLPPALLSSSSGAPGPLASAVWTFSVAPGKPPTTGSDRDRASDAASWPLGARWAPRDPGAARSREELSSV